MANATTASRKPGATGRQARSGTAGRGTRKPAGGARRTTKDSDEGMHVHTAHPSLPIPYLTPGDMTANARAAGAMLPTLRVPGPRQMALYGGLGAMAVFGAIDWPVAVAIGAATAVARSGSGASKR